MAADHPATGSSCDGGEKGHADGIKSRLRGDDQGHGIIGLPAEGRGPGTNQQGRG
jgi:hypothetical protein